MQLIWRLWGGKVSMVWQVPNNQKALIACRPRFYYDLNVYSSSFEIGKWRKMAKKFHGSELCWFPTTTICFHTPISCSNYAPTTRQKIIIGMQVTQAVGVKFLEVHGESKLVVSKMKHKFEIHKTEPHSTPPCCKEIGCQVLIFLHIACAQNEECQSKGSRQFSSLLLRNKNWHKKT